MRYEPVMNVAGHWVGVWPVEPGWFTEWVDGWKACRHGHLEWCAYCNDVPEEDRW